MNWGHWNLRLQMFYLRFYLNQLLINELNDLQLINSYSWCRLTCNFDINCSFKVLTRWVRDIKLGVCKGFTLVEWWRPFLVSGWRCFLFNFCLRSWIEININRTGRRMRNGKSVTETLSNERPTNSISQNTRGFTIWDFFWLIIPWFVLLLALFWVWVWHFSALADDAAVWLAQFGRRSIVCLPSIGLPGPFWRCFFLFWFAALIGWAFFWGGSTGIIWDFWTFFFLWFTALFVWNFWWFLGLFEGGFRFNALIGCAFLGSTGIYWDFWPFFRDFVWIYCLNWLWFLAISRLFWRWFLICCFDCLNFGIFWDFFWDILGFSLIIWDFSAYLKVF